MPSIIGNMRGMLNPRNRGAKVGELHNQLRALGATIAPGEIATTAYGPSTVAAVRAFRERYSLPAGDAVDAPTGRLMHVASTFAESGVALLNAVPVAAATADTGQPQETLLVRPLRPHCGRHATAKSIPCGSPGRGGRGCDRPGSVPPGRTIAKNHVVEPYAYRMNDRRSTRASI
jgi:peptidoglycan hydrolase-like protein with peptidoglycan-binding domain